jgi:hypothetical protein
MTEAESNGGVAELQRELAHERAELSLAVGRLERSASNARHRLVLAGAALAGALVAAGVLLALARALLRRRSRPRTQVVARVGDLMVVRRTG